MSGDARTAMRSLPFAKRDLHFRIGTLAMRAQITSIGREYRVGGDGYDWHGLRRGPGGFVVLQYTLAGAGRLRWEGATHELGPGRAMLVRIPHDHRYWVPDGGSWDFAWICLLGSDLSAACQAVHQRIGPVLELGSDHPVLAAMAAGIGEGLGGSPPGAWRGSALAYAIAMALDEAAMAAGPADVHPGLLRAERRCRDTLDAEVPITELAALAGLSRNHFTRRFQAAFGKAPKEYHTALRVQHAADLLRQGGVVKDVAAACGFPEATYFCKVFRRFTGMSPGAFRDGGMFIGSGR
jgi:AraC-like DNA-binding protein